MLARLVADKGANLRSMLGGFGLPDVPGRTGTSGSSANYSADLGLPGWSPDASLDIKDDAENWHDRGTVGPGSSRDAKFWRDDVNDALLWIVAVDDPGARVQVERAIGYICRKPG